MLLPLEKFNLNLLKKNESPLLQRLKSTLQKENLWAKKSLGQNFLIDESILNQIVETAQIKPNDTILEVGPGTGLLTEKILQKANQVIAVEYDEDMVQILKKKFKDAKNLQIIHSDILNLNLKSEILNLKSYKVVANIPYYITSPLIKKFLQEEKNIESITLLIQNEVAEKITSRKGKSMITIETELFGKPEYQFKVPAECFYPAPKVTSAVIQITPHSNTIFEKEELKDFLRVVKFGFSQKRKKLANSLSAGIRKKTKETRLILESAQLNSDCRAEDLTLENWIKLYETLKSKSDFAT